MLQGIKNFAGYEERHVRLFRIIGRGFEIVGGLFELAELLFYFVVACCVAVAAFSALIKLVS